MISLLPAKDPLGNMMLRRRLQFVFATKEQCRKLIMFVKQSAPLMDKPLRTAFVLVNSVPMTRSAINVLKMLTIVRMAKLFSVSKAIS